MNEARSAALTMFFSLQPDASLHYKTTHTRLVHLAVWLFTSHLLPVLIAPTHGGMARLRLSWLGWLVAYRDGLPVCRWSLIQVLTRPSWCDQRRYELSRTTTKSKLGPKNSFALGFRLYLEKKPASVIFYWTFSNIASAVLVCLQSFTGKYRLRVVCNASVSLLKFWCVCFLMSWRVISHGRSWYKNNCRLERGGSSLYVKAWPHERVFFAVAFCLPRLHER